MNTDKKDTTVDEFMTWARHHAYPEDTPDYAEHLGKLVQKIGRFDAKAARLFAKMLQAADKLSKYLRERYNP